MDEICCLKCGTLHDPDAKTYFTVAGNLYIGNNGGLIGNNFDDTGLLARASAFCLGCLLTDLVDVVAKLAVKTPT